MNSTAQLMKDLLEVDGIPGSEGDVRKKVKGYLEPLSDEILYDRLGSVIGKKIGQADGPRVLVAGHLDEIGFMVTQITDKGFLRFQQLGGWWSHNVLSHRVNIKTKQGDVLGIIGSKAPHVLAPEERTKLLQLKDMFIDVGAKNKEEVEEMGIRLGDPVTPVSDFFTMRNGELWGGKALDNRAGCGIAIEILKRLQNDTHPNTVFSGATVQEEVGLRGAITAANLVKPDIAFAVDVGIAYDTPGMESIPFTCNLGEGPIVLLMDATMIAHTGLRNLVIDTAEELDIPLQFDALMGGGTDAGRFHLHGIGCPTVSIGLPTRYIHSHNGIMSSKDFEQTVELLTAVIKKLDQEKLQELIS